MLSINIKAVIATAQSTCVKNSLPAHTKGIWDTFDSQVSPRLGKQSGLQGSDAFDAFELILFQMEFHVLGMVHHKVQAGVHNPHVSKRSHIGVGSTVMLFHWKILK